MELREHKRLIAYLPGFLQEYKELQAIMAADQMELDAVYGKIDQLLLNMFTDTADLEGLERREKMYGIVPGKSATIEQRRLDVKTKETNSLPYTIRQYKDMLLSMCGEGNYYFNLDTDNYFMLLRLRVTTKDAPLVLSAIDALTMRLKPCNLVYDSALFDYHSGKAMTYSGAAVSVFKHYNLEVM